ALIHLRKVQPGDRVLFYHTGKEKAIVGETRVVKAKDGEVTVAPVRRLAKPVPLTEIKKVSALKTRDLVRNSRLSVMPVTPEQWQKIEEMSKDRVSEPRTERSDVSGLCSAYSAALRARL